MLESLLRFERPYGEMVVAGRDQGRQRGDVMLLRTNHFVEKVWEMGGQLKAKNSLLRGTWNPERLNNSVHVTQLVRGRTGIETLVSLRDSVTIA